MAEGGGLGGMLERGLGGALSDRCAGSASDFAGWISWITSTEVTSGSIPDADRVVALVEFAAEIADNAGDGGFSISGFGAVGLTSAGRASKLGVGAFEREVTGDAPRLTSSWIENGAGLISALGVCFGSIVQSLSISRSNLG